MFTRCLRLAVALCLLGALRTPAAVLYVNVNSTNPVSPFSSWATAATNIQDAVDAANTGDEVLVTNGVFEYGGRIVPAVGYAPSAVPTNRLVVTNAITVQSVNGPAVTIIQGSNIIGPRAVRCTYLDNGAQLIGFTLTNGATQYNVNQSPGPVSGGGVLSPSLNATLSNCIICGNSAYYLGGGV